MSALAFGLLFGNKDKANWSKFWAFVKRTHPSIDAFPKTILADQDKGLIAAVKYIFEQAAQFMCAFHRRQNILSSCGGGKGNIPHTALWMFNLLCSCNSMAEIQQKKEKDYENYIRLTCTISPNCPTNVSIRPPGVQWETITACSASWHLQVWSQ
jgi:hypothetical protein